MNRDELKPLIKQQAMDVRRQTGCPDDNVLASYVEGGLSERDHGRFETHLADCGYCLERVGMLGRANDVEGVTRVPELDVARAAKLAGQPVTRSPGWRIPTRWAAAAVVVLAIGMIAQFSSPGPGLGPDSPNPAVTPDTRTTRSIKPDALSPGLAPPPGIMEITIEDGAFEWSLVPESLYYEVRIVSDEGDLLWQERVENTRWAIPPELALNAGVEYFVRVDAFISESKSLNSDFVMFTAGPVE